MKQWSISAHNCSRRCQRQFFFKHLMASHNARDTLRREAHLLNQLRGLNEWRGNVVHLAMEEYFVPSLEQSSLISREELTEQTIKLAEEQYSFSERADYKRGDVTKSSNRLQYLALREHEYQIGVTKEQLETIFQQIRQCYEFLYSQDKFIKFLQRGEWYSAEPNLIFKLDEQSVVAKLDLVMKYDRSKLCIIDWKIGESFSDYSRQLRLYAMAALKRWTGFKPSDLLLVEANLLQGRIKTHRINEDALLEIEDLIYCSLSDLRVLTGGKPYAEQDINDYGFANSPGSCALCNFQSLCLRLSNDQTHFESVPLGRLF